MIDGDVRFSLMTTTSTSNLNNQTPQLTQSQQPILLSRTMTSAALARIATRSLARRSTTAAMTKSYSTSLPTLGGATPPLPPFTRIPPESEKLVEQYDAIWDDGVAPEVTLDFDCQHISSGEGLVSVRIIICTFVFFCERCCFVLNMDVCKYIF